MLCPQHPTVMGQPAVQDRYAAVVVLGLRAAEDGDAEAEGFVDLELRALSHVRRDAPVVHE